MTSLFCSSRPSLYSCSSNSDAQTDEEERRQYERALRRDRIRSAHSSRSNDRRSMPRDYDDRPERLNHKNVCVKRLKSSHVRLYRIAAATSAFSWTMDEGRCMRRSADRSKIIRRTAIANSAVFSKAQILTIRSRACKDNTNERFIRARTVQ